MSVFGRVMLAGLFGVVGGVVQVAFRNVSMMAGLFMVAGLMMAGGSLVMFRGVFVVLRCLPMVLRGFFRHVKFSFKRQLRCLGFRKPGTQPTGEW